MKLLLAEDEKDLSNALTAVLTHKGYDVDPVYDGEEAVEKAHSGNYDGMIFDIMMPKKDGVTALKEIRDSGDLTPVLLLTAKSEVDDRINGLDAGADDYLTKPFAMGELLARIRSMTRRSGNKYSSKELELGKVRLNTGEQELSSENSIRLARKETLLMEYFMLNPGREITSEEILGHVWKDEPEADNKTVLLYVSYLRSKLQAIAADLTIAGEEGGSFSLIQNEK
ncbi:MAG: response regulator transcription factor [Lachnospiraceae bacterium]|jgi:DNA-binding response OmpR family regulator|nr:response regulator transcription factor [Lachnospiraceae bacterium]MEE3460864.1 response regulator transcription factor [Lachnospiraceae bacterium]